MLKEDYCSYEVAKLLKEKGFLKGIDLRTTQNLSFYDNIGLTHNLNKWYDSLIQDKIDFIVAPTLQMAMKWLREIYHLEINISFGFPFIDGKQHYKYFWSIVRVCDNHLEYPMDDPESAFYNEEMADSYEDTVEAALEYTLENLI